MPSLVWSVLWVTSPGGGALTADRDPVPDSAFAEPAAAGNVPARPRGVLVRYPGDGFRFLMETFGSATKAIKSLAASPRTKPLLDQ